MDEQTVISPSGLRSPARYVVVHDFTASKSDEIDLLKGDIVLIVKKYRDGWYRGVRCRGYQVGCFPGNFVAIEASPADTARSRSFSFEIEAPPPLPPKATKPIKTGLLIDITEEEPSDQNIHKNQYQDFCQLEFPEIDEAPALPMKSRNLKKQLEIDVNYNTDDSFTVNNQQSHNKHMENEDDIGNGFDPSVHRGSSISTSSFMGLKMLQDSDMSKYSEDSNERKRTRAAEELLTSEMSYFSGLNVLISNYLKPLRDLNIISKEDIQRIFSNVETLASISKEMVSNLQKRLAKWDAETTVIGDALLELFSYLKMFEPYFNSRNKGNEVKCRLEKNNEKFKSITAKIINGQTMNSLLLMPIQRIPRYEMLLKELVKRTKEDHPDYGNLKEALSKAQKAAADLNEHIRRIENETKVIEVMKSFPNDELQLIHSANKICLGRTFGSGRLKKQEREQMYTINKKLKRMSLPLANAIDVSPKIPRSNTASPVPGIRLHVESDSDSDSDTEPAILGDKFITSIYVYEGSVERVTRKATGSNEGGMVHETVERYLFLFNDVLLISMASDNLITGKRTHKLKTAIPLCQSWVTNAYVYYSSPPENMFLLGTPSHVYKFLAPSVKEKDCWEQKLREYILQAKESLTQCFKGIPLPNQQFTAVTVEAKIDYHKTIEVELNLREKEEVLVMGYKDGNVWRPGLYQNDVYDFTTEWWPGIQKGKFGWFPAQCVTGPDVTTLSVPEEGIHPIPTAVALNQIKRTMMIWTGSKSLPFLDIKVVKIYRPDKTFKTCKVESEFSIADVLRQYTLHKSFCGAQIDTNSLDLWEESLDGSVHKLLPQDSRLCDIIGTWGEYKVNMKLVIREKKETRAGSKSAILDM